MTDGDLSVAYNAALDAATTLEKLRAVMVAFHPLVWDATKIVSRMDYEQFGEFREALRNERAGNFARTQDVRFGAVLAPIIILQISLIAKKKNRTWSEIYEALISNGYLAPDANGYLQWRQK